MLHERGEIGEVVPIAVQLPRRAIDDEADGDCYRPVAGHHVSGELLRAEQIERRRSSNRRDGSREFFAIGARRSECDAEASQIDDVAGHSRPDGTGRSALGDNSQTTRDLAQPHYPDQTTVSDG